ncbi:MAG: hypothetical protein JNK15_15000 [Planctomycetes bacterium]|nr:hypothetical protein [Planctomycetota bacterium]
MLFLHNTSRVEDEPYPTLLQDKGFRGFPSICFMDAEGNVLAKPGRSVQAFRDGLASTKSLVVLRQKGDKATPAEQKELFLAELKLDLVAVADIQARADKLTLTDAEKGMVASKIVDGEIMAVMQKGRELGQDEMLKQLADMAKGGKTPSDAVAPNFWPAVLNWASKAKDAALAQKAFDALEKRFANDKNPNLDRAKKSWAKLLEDAKAK